MFDLRSRRLELDLTLSEVAKAIGVTEATVSRYESGNIKNMRRDRIEKYSKILKIDPTLIIGIHEDTPDEINIPTARPVPQMHYCKYYHSVSAGIGTHADENADTYGYYFSCQSQAEHCFAVDVQGDSMIPKLLDGDIAIVDTEAEPQNGDIVVFYDKSDELGYIKRINRSDNVVMFISDNPSYAPMVFPLSDIGSRIQISGRVIAKIDNNF